MSRGRFCVTRKRVICFASYFLPGFKSGGPVRSLVSLFEALKDEFEFRVVTRNRDLGDAAAYPNRRPGEWYAESGVLVSYLDRPFWAPWRLARVVDEAAPDLLYFNSFMDPDLSIAPLVSRHLGVGWGGVPAVIAPRGEFSPGAIGIKAAKKATYVAVARRMGIYRDVVWHATSELERQHISDWWGESARVVLAPIIPAPPPDAMPPRKRDAGPLRVVFVSRIDRKKNLLGALEVLSNVKNRVVFDIYGTKEDMDYWGECEKVIGRLPSNVRVAYRGVLSPDDVSTTIATYDVFFLPTYGENFGHVILEALLAGCPVLTSDQTPWRLLGPARAGFDLPLGEEAAFARAIDEFASMDGEALGVWSRGARNRGLAYCRNPELVAGSRALFQEALGRGSGSSDVG